MTKIKLISDIHTESHLDNGKKFISWLPNEDVDVLVIAGDLSTGFKKRIKPNLKQFCDRFPEVVYVTGNHDHWHTSIQERYDQLARLDARVSNLHWLECQRKEIAGQYFAGCTMWFDIYQTPVMSNWPDYLFISGDAALQIHGRYEAAKTFLENEVRKGDVVVTHHLPSQKCIASRWIGNVDNCFYVTPMDDVMKVHKPAFWLFGHTHDQRHLQIEETELFCNPRGYTGERGPRFVEDLIIDTELDTKYE